MQDTGEGTPVPREPIALIGIGCRFPGANGPESFWRLLREGVDAIREVPADRFDIDAVYDPRPGKPGKLISRCGGFLEGVDRFDFSFFGISPREAARMDPQQRLLLEVAWEALEDAGQTADALSGSATGVFIGLCTSDYLDALSIRDYPAAMDNYINSGNARSVVPGRISHAMGLHGPSLTVDVACASSLVAVQLACRSIWDGECAQALAGGVNLLLVPEHGFGFSQAGMLAPDGRCKFGDAGADGFVRSDGVGIVVLKPLSLALTDGDPVYALIRGGAANNDGRRSGSLMSPSAIGQEEVLRAAYRDAGVDPLAVRYVEAHGTGTAAGDPAEVTALAEVLGSGRAADQPCFLGSAKTNIGHTEGAAGVAGLIKAALVLKHRLIPPSLHLRTPNPAIPWHALSLRIPGAPQPWPDNATAYAGVSAFGISGTNAHLVLEEAPPPATRMDSSDGEWPLVLSARSPEALAALARSHAAALAGHAGSWYDHCYTAATRRTHHDHRLALIAGSAHEAAAVLQAFGDGGEASGIHHSRREGRGRPALVWVFPGHGPQWVGMGRDLAAHEPVFREALAACDAAMWPELGWSVAERLATLSEQDLDDGEVIGPLIFAVQMALAALWRAWGIVPDAVVGHSMGEVAAACVAGALSLVDAARTVCRRSLLLGRTGGLGTMLLLDLPVRAAQESLAGFEDRLSVGAINSPTSTVIAGDHAALAAFGEQLDQRGVFYRRVKIGFAAHSPLVDPLCPELIRALADLAPRPPSIPFYSTALEPAEGPPRFDGEYWAANMRCPVQFAAAVERLLAEGHGTFLEISAHPVLLGSIGQSLSHLGAQGTLLASLRREEGRGVPLDTLGTLFALGFDVAWGAVFHQPGRCVALPQYPWQGERCWLDLTGPRLAQAPRAAAGHRDGHHPLLGPLVRPADQPGTYIWEIDLTPISFPFLIDHQLDGTVIFPAAAWIEMALAAGTTIFEGPLALEDLSFEQALFLPAGTTRAIQLVLNTRGTRAASFTVFSRAAAEGQAAAWTRHVQGTLHSSPDIPALPPANLPAIAARCTTIMDADTFYPDNEPGVRYGPSMRGVRECRTGQHEALADLHVPAAAGDGAGYHLHPALLDALFQIWPAATPRELRPGEGYVPVRIERLQIYQRPGAADAIGHAVFRATAPGGRCIADLSLHGPDGVVLLELTGLCSAPLDGDRTDTAATVHPEWLFSLHWERLQVPTGDRRPGTWLILADRRAAGSHLAKQLRARDRRVILVDAGPMFAHLDDDRYTLDPAEAEGLATLLETPALEGILHLWSLDIEPAAHPDDRDVMGWGSALRLIQALAAPGAGPPPRLWLATAGVQSPDDTQDPVSVSQAPLWGLGRTVQHEHPNLGLTLIDVDAEPDDATIATLAEVLLARGEEGQLALRGDRLYGARLVPHVPAPLPPPTLRIRAGDDSLAYRVTIGKPGLLDTLTLRSVARRSPGSGEIEIRVRAAGMNFRDTLQAMGFAAVLPPGQDPPLGKECAGTIVAVGPDAGDLRVGDAVIALNPPDGSGLFRSFVTVPASCAVRKPERLDFPEAATAMIAYLTAVYTLRDLAQMLPGERVLIHAATGGVGLAAIHLTMQAGAEIYATAGSEEKRAYLRALGIRHVFDSRSLTFVDGVREATGGEGVDIVLNSLAGEFIPAGLAVLRPFGRFLEIGKRDIHEDGQLGLAPFKNDLQFFAVDLTTLFALRPARAAALCQEVAGRLASGDLPPLPTTVYPAAEAAEVFRLMAQARHTGRLALSFEEAEVQVEAPSGARGIRPDATYLITGGLGGIGAALAHWLLDQGAAHLVLVGRNSPSGTAAETLAALQHGGADVRFMAADVGSEPEMSRLLESVAASMPPLRGIFHAAGLLDDGIALQLDPERFERVLRPKRAGAWNLHTLTQHLDLDYFVLFSSVASLLGSPGQANYAAANAFLDALAHHRRSLGLAATSINWGPWAEIGMAARADLGPRLAAHGLGSIPPEQGLACLGYLLGRDATQIAVLPLDVPSFTRTLSGTARSLLAILLDSGAVPHGPEATLPHRIRAVPAAERPGIVEAFLLEQVAQVLTWSAARLDIHKPVTAFGIDSLMAIELRNRLEVRLGVRVPVVELLRGASIAELGASILRELGTGQASPTADPSGQVEWEEGVL